MATLLLAVLLSWGPMPVYRVCRCESYPFVWEYCGAYEVDATLVGPPVPACFVPTPCCAVYDGTTGERVENATCGVMW